MKTRIYFLDNLRTLMIFLVVVLHAAMTYMSGFDFFWIVDDPDKINSLGLLTMYIDIFVMFTVFFISGYLIPISLNSKNSKDFILSKLKRIMLPWVLAVFTLIPAYKAIFLASRGFPQEEWLSYFHLFSRHGDQMWYFANNPTQSWLWFLPVLFVFQMIYLGLAMVNFFNIKLSLKTAVVLTFILGVAYNMTISSLEQTGWYSSWFIHFQKERLIPYLLVFLLGSLTHKKQIFVNAVKNKRQYIAANVILTVALGLFTAVALNLFFNILDPEREYYFISSFADRTAYYAFSMLSMISLLYVMLYAIYFSFNKTNPLMKMLSKSSYQVYIVHMIVLGVVALLLTHSGLPAMAKYLLLVVITYVISNALVWAYNEVMRDRTVLKIGFASIFLLSLMLSVQAARIEADSNNEVIAANDDKITKPALDLHSAVIANDLEAIKQHIAAGSDLNIKEPSGGSSPLITAALFNRPDAAGLLLEAGADINLQNNDGSTALITAAFFGRTAIVKQLLENGADKTITNKSGSTALASASAPLEMVQGIYDYFRKALGPMGFELDDDMLKQARPEIVVLLSE